jgi:protein-disulfide isomerase
MSNRRERERRRDERLQAEAHLHVGDRRTKLLQLAAGAVFLAIAVVVVLIVANASGGGDGGDTNLEGVAEVNGLLAGIPQEEMLLGDPKAPVELIEFGDLQCPVCKGFAEEILPPVIEGQVRDGEATLEFRNFTIISQQSIPAGAAAIAAGEQGRGWNFVELFYRNQGTEASGYVTDDFLTAIARAAGVADIAGWNQARKSKRVIAEVEASKAEAERLGFSGTPSFAIEGPGSSGLETLGTPQSSGAIESAVENAS